MRRHQYDLSVEAGYGPGLYVLWLTEDGHSITRVLEDGTAWVGGEMRPVPILVEELERIREADLEHARAEIE